jgi:hypothetical protein
MFSVGEPSPRKIELSDAKYLSLVAGADDSFAVVHHWDGNRLEISAHCHSEPRRAISRLLLHLANPGIYANPTISFEGDHSVWDRLPKAFTAYAFGDFRLVLTKCIGDAEVQTFAWFDSRYDKGYQGIVGATEVPNSGLLIIAVQRDSAPVLYDPGEKQALRKLQLADRHGNPEFRPRMLANELWASDYDSIVKLDASSLTTIKSVRVQDAPVGTQKFMGDFCFNRDESLCWIARPFSGDAVGLDADSMHQKFRVELGSQPLDIGLLADGTLLARDWKTGNILSGGARS